VILLVPFALMLLGFLWWPSLPSHWTAVSPLQWLLMGVLYVVLEAVVEGFGALVLAPFRRRHHPAVVIVADRWQRASALKGK